MSVLGLLAVVPVTDHDTAIAWYTELLERAPDTRPMPGLAEWQVTGAGLIQVFADRARAGRTLLNLAIDDLDAEISRLAGHGVRVGEVSTVTSGARLATVTDPDGNTITLIQNP
ncbi:VOC family protein [Amycolatopsis nigrescens]|uniref:VOC family protein n=1 Tax=Amycolatopsis nigrescens TaxID=381445 RepID=UPI00036E8696|nr:VOC family protein [Amycolatopsis nigrescens]